MVGRLSVCLGGGLASWRAGTMYCLSTGKGQDVNKRKGSMEGVEGRGAVGAGRAVSGGRGRRRGYGRERRVERWRMGNVRVRG